MGWPQSRANGDGSDMPTALWFLLQAASTVTPSDFDLKSLDPPARPDPPHCATPDSSDEIVVCGRTDVSRYRYRDLPNPYAEKPVRAEMGLGGAATGKVEAQEVMRPDGIPDKRIMFTFKTKF